MTKSTMQYAYATYCGVQTYREKFRHYNVMYEFGFGYVDCSKTGISLANENLFPRAANSEQRLYDEKKPSRIDEKLYTYQENSFQ